MKKVVFLKNALILTATSLFLRLAGVVMKVWLANKIGGEGLGLYQLVFSFYLLAATFATSGISTAVTRLVADELCLGTQNGIKKIMAAAFGVTVLIAALSNASVFLFAETIAKVVIHDVRAAASLKILSFSLLFMGVSSCIKGYFIARRKTLPPSSAQIIEQAARIVSVMLLVGKFAPRGIEYACYAVFLSDFIAETVSCFYLFLLYRKDGFYISRLCGRERPDYSIGKQIWHIAAPISVGRYVNSGLRTVENTLVPAKLMLSGMENAAALEAFGRIKGMVLPLLFFPSSLLGAFATLLIPEVSEARARGRTAALSKMTERILTLTLTVGIVFGFIFFTAGDQIGELIYKDPEVGRLIVRLAPIVPLMYLDSIADGILKGIDKQKATFRASVSDSAIRILLITLVLPKYGLDGFILIMYASNLYTCALNVITLLRATNTKIPFLSKIALPCLCAAAVTLSLNRVLRYFSLPNILFTVIFVGGSVFAYAALLIITKSISVGEIRETIT
ncbi:MAG: oligosaccharide flippase family protein [Clostridiales bacterium]|nr:oligosaccharide flippase family protein [Candidatus Equinaster intestinalis]